VDGRGPGWFLGSGVILGLFLAIWDLLVGCTKRNSFEHLGALTVDSDFSRLTWLGKSPGMSPVLESVVDWVGRYRWIDDDLTVEFVGLSVRRKDPNYALTVGACAFAGCQNFLNLPVFCRPILVS